MEAISPVVKSVGSGPEVQIAADQPQYRTLPVLATVVAVMSRWRLSDEERAAIAAGADLYIIQANFSSTLQPIRPIIELSDEDALVDLKVTSQELVTPVSMVIPK
jgi:hypothetical protein